MMGIMTMQPVNLAAMDLNLLRVLDAVLGERHLTRAAARVGLSQPATSHALARLRRLFGDPLFVRTREGLVPTARAEALAAPLHEALALLTRCVEGAAAFDPATTRRRFTVATADYGLFVLIPPLLERLGREAPGADLWVRAVASDPFEQLARGDADVVLSPLDVAAPPAAIHARTLYEERFVCMVRQGHPRVKRTLDLATFASLPHVFIAPRGTPGGAVDEALARRGLERRVALAVPHFLVAPHVVAGSNLILTIGARVADAFVGMLPLRIVEPPLEIPTFIVKMVWHERQHHDAGLSWFRALMADVARTRLSGKKGAGGVTRRRSSPA